MEFFMSLIKKSDVHRHLSTKSRENREQPRPYGAADPTLENIQPAVAPAEATNDSPVVVPGNGTSGN